LKSSHCNAILRIALKVTVKDAPYMKLFLLVVTILCTLLTFSQNDRFSTKTIKIGNQPQNAKDSLAIKKDITDNVKIESKTGTAQKPKLDSLKLKTHLQLQHLLTCALEKDNIIKGLTYPGTNIQVFDPIQYMKELNLMNQLINGLEKDGLLDSKKPYWVNIKEGELYINGKKQPKEVSDKFRQFFQSDNYGFQKS